MKVLAITCHPDDMEILCCGTLIKCIKRGDTVTVCHVANGNMGHEVILPEELREIRLGEAQKSAQLAGIKTITTDIGDLLVDGANIEQRDKIAQVIRQEQPDFIITHAPNDYMSDHRAVAKLVFDASFVASVPHYGTGDCAEVTPIYYMDTDKGINNIPTEYVDISAEIDLKIKMLECHESQVKWIKDHDDVDLIEEALTISRFRGLQCNCKYAEAFTQELVFPKIVAKRLLP